MRNVLAIAAIAWVGVFGCGGDDEGAGSESPDSGEMTQDGGAPDGGDDAGSDASDAPVEDASSSLPPGDDPVIPEPDGECPDFVTGTQDIMGLSTEIVAGTPGDVKGPLLITWHGTGGTGQQALRQLPQSVQDDITSQGGIVIAPSSTMMERDGNDVTFILGVWYDGADLAYADHLVACAVQNHNIDPRRIYVTGCSAGGLMTGVMSLMRSSYVAAAAPNSGGVALPDTFAFDDEAHPPAVFAMHGGTDDTVYVNFGDTTHYLGDQMKEAGGFFVECNHMIGHCQAPPELHEQAWEFMKAHPYGITASPFESALPDDYPDYCAIY